MVQILTIYILTFLLFAWGLSTLLKILFKADSTAGRKNIKIHKKRQMKDAGRTSIDILINPIVKSIAKIIRINPYKEKQLINQLEGAQISLTPKEYYAKAYTYLILPILVIPLAYFLGLWMMIPLLVFLGVLLFYRQINSVKGVLKNKEEHITKELPRFIRSITMGLKSERDIIKLIEKYLVVADALKFDLELLLMEMKSGNIENALIKFSARISHPYVTRLTTALINIDNGIDQTNTLEYLASDMVLLARENVKKELGKRPRLMNKAMLPAAFICIAIFFYVIGKDVFSSISLLFS